MRKNLIWQTAKKPAELPETMHDKQDVTMTNVNVLSWPVVNLLFKARFHIAAIMAFSLFNDVAKASDEVLAKLSKNVAEELLSCQARCEWTGGLLAVFEDDGTTAWQGIPVWMFPLIATDRDGKELVDSEFSAWCKEQLEIARFKGRYAKSLKLLCENLPIELYNEVLFGLTKCISHEVDAPNTIRLSALGALVNDDADMALKSLIVYCLHFSNNYRRSNYGTLKEASKQANSDGPKDIDADWHVLYGQILAILATRKESAVLSGYIRLAYLAKNDKIQSGDLEDAINGTFYNPFYLSHGSLDQVYGVNLSQSGIDDSFPRIATKIVVSERAVLNSYRQEIAAGSAYTEGPIGRRELSKLLLFIIELYSSHFNNVSVHADNKVIDLLLCRLVQVDDLGVVFAITPLIQNEINALVNGDHEANQGQTVREVLAAEVIKLLKRTSVEPKRMFGVSTVDAFESLDNLRQVGGRLERGLL